MSAMSLSCSTSTTTTSTIDVSNAHDMHHHLRDGDALKVTVGFASKQFSRIVVMPNTTPPITTTAMALAYRERILSNVDQNDKNTASFTPLMTLYLTDSTTSDEIQRAKESGIVFAVKYYPAGATTNSESGVTDLAKLHGVLLTMQKIQMPLLVHGEVTDKMVDIFDREAECIEKILKPLVMDFPDLKIVMEHITTEQAVEFVTQTGPTVAATITPQHLLFNRNAIFQGGLRPHKYCLPVLKRERHRLALIRAIQSGNSKFFLGTDSAPHAQHTKESACGCAGIFSAHAALELYATAFEQAGCLPLLRDFACKHGPAFYNLPELPIGMNKKGLLVKQDWIVPASYPFKDGQKLVPLHESETLHWKLNP